MKPSIIKIFVLFCLLTTSLVSSARQIDKNEVRLMQVLTDAHIPEYHYQVMNKYPHAQTSFTEGLILLHDDVYESTGLNGQSKLLKIKMTTGKILKKYALPHQYFAEGIAVLHNQLYQLTYQEQIAFVYDMHTFEIINTFPYVGEGWGLTTDGKQLIMSNGTGVISFVDPNKFNVIRSIHVKVNEKEMRSLNELEYVNGLIYANVWPTSIIVIFSPQNGQVVGWLNVSNLKFMSSGAANGIAYDKRNKLLIVTGKNWPNMYALSLTD